MFKIPFHNFGGEGSVIHFAHANGFPPGCYQQFLTPFKDHYKVIGMQQRPLWKNSQPQELKNWDQLAEDLILFFEQNKLKNIINIGHSMGASISILAAIKRPDLFSKLVLIDPPGLFPKKMAIFNALTPIAWRKKIIPIAKIASKRRDKWDNQHKIFNSFRKKSVFKRFSDESLWDLVKASTTKRENLESFTLAYPKAWETQIYVLSLIHI